MSGSAPPRSAHSRRFRSTYLGTGGPREIEIFSHQHDKTKRVWLTELHEMTHFHLFQTSITGRIQDLCDTILSRIESDDGSDELLQALLQTDYDSLSAAYETAKNSSIRLHEVTASYCEYALASVHGMKSEYKVILEERSHLYQLPLLEDCFRIDERLLELYAVGSLRGQIVYTIARISLDRRLKASKVETSTMGEYFSRLLCSAETPDKRFVAFFEKILGYWPSFKKVIQEADNRVSSIMGWQGSAEELLRSMIASKASGEQHKEFEGHFKDTMYEALAAALDREAFSNPEVGFEYYKNEILPEITAYLGSRGIPLEMAWLPPQVAPRPKIAYASEQDALVSLLLKEDLPTDSIIEAASTLFDDGAERHMAYIVVHVAEGHAGWQHQTMDTISLAIPPGCHECTLVACNYFAAGDAPARGKLHFATSPYRIWDLASRIGSVLTAVIVSCLKTDSEPLAREFARSVPFEDITTILSPAASMFAETIEHGAYKVGSPAAALFVKQAPEDDNGMVFLIGENEPFWIADYCSAARMGDLHNWVVHQEAVTVLRQSPFPNAILNDIMFVFRSWIYAM